MIGTTVNLMQSYIHCLNEDEDGPHDSLMLVIKMKKFLCFCVSSPFIAIVSYEGLSSGYAFCPDEQPCVSSFMCLLFK